MRRPRFRGNDDPDIVVAMFRVRARGLGPAVLLAVALAWPATLHAAPAGDAAALASKAQQEFQAARGAASRNPLAAARRYAKAADLYGQAAARLPETAEHRETRADLLGQAGSAYIEAHRLAPADPTPLRAARSLAEVHLAALTASYGEAASGLQEHALATALVREVDGLLGADAAAVPAEPAQERPRPTGPDWRRVGLGASVGVALAAGAFAMGTGFAVTRAPFTGPAYEKIVREAELADVPNGEKDDMCALGRQMSAPGVIAACERRDRLLGTSIGMSVIAGVAAVTAVTFGVLLARSKRPTAAKLRRHGVAVTVAPAAGGLSFGAGARF
jgi:hypothetical protein